MTDTEQFVYPKGPLYGFGVRFYPVGADKFDLYIYPGEIAWHTRTSAILNPDIGLSRIKGHSGRVPASLLPCYIYLPYDATVIAGGGGLRIHKEGEGQTEIYALKMNDGEEESFGEEDPEEIIPQEVDEDFPDPMSDRHYLYRLERDESVEDLLVLKSLRLVANPVFGQATDVIVEGDSSSEFGSVAVSAYDGSNDENRTTRYEVSLRGFHDEEALETKEGEVEVLIRSHSSEGESTGRVLQYMKLAVSDEGGGNPPVYKPKSWDLYVAGGGAPGVRRPVLVAGGATVLSPDTALTDWPAEPGTYVLYAVYNTTSQKPSLDRLGLATPANWNDRALFGKCEIGQPEGETPDDELRIPLYEIEVAAGEGEEPSTWTETFDYIHGMYTMAGYV